MAGKEPARLPKLERDHQAAIRDRAALRADQGPRHLHHHRSRPASDVGGAVLSVPGAEALDDVRRARHDGLWAAGRDRRAARASKLAGDRHRRRSLDPDEHAGNVDRRAVRPAGQGLHSQQSVYGHGAAVAGTAAWRALFAFLYRSAAGFRQARRGLSRPRHPLRKSRRSRRQNPRNDRGAEAGDLRLRGRSVGKLLPDDPVGARPYRDAARRRGNPRRGRRDRTRQDASLSRLKAHKLPTGEFRVSTTAKTSHYPAQTSAEKVETRTLCVLVDNEPGVLARVVGLFSGRGYNIDSLTVSETEHQKHLSRITIVTRGTPMVLEQIKNQLDRLVPVHRVVDLTTAGPAIARELAMVKVHGTGDQRMEALRLADAFRARVIDATTESFVFEITGASAQNAKFVTLMLPVGLVEVSRTGVVAITRGPEGM